MVSQYLQGIGSGGNVESSGETIIFKYVNDLHKNIIFDVGANKGQFLELAMSNLDHKKCKFHIFEPGKSTFNILTDKFNGKQNIIFNNCALGSKKGTGTLYYNEQSSGLASLTKRDLQHFSIQFDESETVNVETLDNYCKERNIERINLLKIDVEGHELDVLKGALNMLNNDRIDVITFEFGGCNIDTKTFFKDFYDFLRRFEMSIYRITPGGFLYDISDYKEMLEQFRTTNFISFKKEVS